MTYTGKRLYKSSTEKVCAGVLGGVAEYFNIDPTLVRLAYVLLTLFFAGFPGIIGYIIMWIVVPSRPVDNPYNTPYQQPYSNGQQPPYNGQQPPQY